MRNSFRLVIVSGLMLLANILTANPVNVVPVLLESSGNEFVYYSFEGNTPGLKVYRADRGVLTVIDSFSPVFPGEEAFIRKTSPDGRQYNTPRFSLIGRNGPEFYFLDVLTRKVSVYNSKEGTLNEKIVLYPRMLHRVYPGNGTLIFTATAIMFPGKNDPCEDKYFIAKDPSFKDVFCFGTGRDMIKEKDFPITVVFDKGKRAAIYFTKSGEISIYETDKGNLEEKYIVGFSELSKIGEPVKGERLFGCLDRPVLLKTANDKTALFSLEGKEWKVKQVVSGAFQAGVVLEGFMVFVDNGGVLVVKEAGK